MGKRVSGTASMDIRLQEYVAYMMIEHMKYAET